MYQGFVGNDFLALNLRTNLEILFRTADLGTEDAANLFEDADDIKRFRSQSKISSLKHA